MGNLTETSHIRLQGRFSILEIFKISFISRANQIKNLRSYVIYADRQIFIVNVYFTCLVSGSPEKPEYRLLLFPCTMSLLDPRKEKYVPINIS